MMKSALAGISALAALSVDALRRATRRAERNLTMAAPVDFGEVLPLADNLSAGVEGAGHFVGSRPGSSWCCHARSIVSTCLATRPRP
jgi:hypothetical protein